MKTASEIILQFLTLYIFSTKLKYWSNVDFALYREEERYYLKIKYYSSHFSLNSKIKTACQHLAKQRLDDKYLSLGMMFK